VFYNEKGFLRNQTFGGVKILSKDFSHNFCATSLAIWFLDDGGRCSNIFQCVFLTVDNYTSDEIQQIQNKIRTQFNIETRLSQVGVSKKG